MVCIDNILMEGKTIEDSDSGQFGRVSGQFGRVLWSLGSLEKSEVLDY